jgi:hypothetical protein
MAETTHTETGADTPRVFAWCSWHDGFSETARLVQIIEQGSGFGAGLYACARCRKVHGLVPVADR